MRFSETILAGAWVVEPEKAEDERGFFARTFCREEFGTRGLSSTFVQSNISVNRKMGTLRGMHYQLPPHQEVKLVSCPRGAIYDVIIDLRRDSATYCRWFGIELSEENCTMLYLPADFAHGFITLRDNSEVLYLMSEFYRPGSGSGCRWNDPVFDIKWPVPVTIISQRDREYPDFSA